MGGEAKRKVLVKGLELQLCKTDYPKDPMNAMATGVNTVTSTANLLEGVFQALSLHTQRNINHARR